MNGNSDGPGLVGYGTGNGLPDPPGSISGKFIAFPPIVFFDRPDESLVAFLDQIKQRQTAPDIFFGNGDYQPQI